MFLQKYPIIHKGWHFLRTYVLTLPRFDLLLQGAFFIVLLLETNVLLLLRRHYGSGYIPGVMEDWVMIGSSGVEFLVGSLLAWWGRDKRNFALSTTLALASAPGLLMLTVPFADSRYPYVELCGGEVLPRTSMPEPSSSARAALLITCALFCALARISIWAHGFTYLDDHQPDNGPYFYGILISIRLSLGLSGQNMLKNTSLGPDWWQSQLSISSLTLMFAILFTLFPRQMKDFSELNERPVDTGYYQSLGRLVRNKPLVLQTIALALLSAAVFGFVHYDSAYVQARFHMEAYRQDPQTSRTLSDIFRPLVIIFFVMIFRIRFSTRRCDGVKASTASRVGAVVAGVVAVLLAAIAGLSCDLGEIQGLEREYQQPICSQACGCNSVVYGFSPVCGVETQATYFSPCNAGCSQFENLNGFLVFGNCTCGMERAVRGACSLVRCRGVFAAYQVIYTVMLAVAASSFMMQGMVVVRTVRRVDKPVAVGASFAVVALLAFVVGHLLYMLLSYLTCAYPIGYACALHHDTLWAASAGSALLAASSAALCLCACAASADCPPEPTTEL